MSQRIYLDNAATSFPKPEAVYDAVDHYNRRVGAAVGRGAYAESVEVQSVVNRCRQRAAELLGAEDRSRIIFTFNGTDSLNLALHGLLKPGDHAVTSTIEHNSVLRPLRYLSEYGGVEVTHVEPDAAGRVDPARVREAIRPETRLVAIVHASNVSGVVQPIAEIGEVAREAGAQFLVDAAQTAGHLPIDLRSLPIDLLACPGHKGLLGPLGTGLLYLRPGVEEHLKSVRQGGTGTVSEEDRQPEGLPDKYESGNHNAAGLYGLEAGLAWLQERTVAEIHRHCEELTARFCEGAASLEGVTLHGVRESNPNVGVVSVTAAGWEPQVLAATLDEHFGIQTRAGLHCAPGAHRHLGTFDDGGSVRFSFGPFTTGEEIDAAVEALREVTRF